MAIVKLFIRYFLIVMLAFTNAAEDGPIARTPMGRLLGITMISKSGKEFYAFLQVPYAKPPINELRFQAPQAGEPWFGTKDAREPSPFCIQISVFDPQHKVVGQEDCLYLSVYTKSFSGHAPVLVHFHGGAYTMGNNRIYGPQYLMDSNIVVVSVNYRVGIFGFLSFESSEMPGNQAMKDQVMALQWVQKNIASFGGDPNLVTIIGESAGGGSVYNHLVSSQSKGLFHRAIAESGSSYSPWSLAPPGFAKSRAEKLMALLGCPQTQKEALACAMKRDAEEIVQQFLEFIEWQMDPVVTFGPVLEKPGPNAFLIGPVSKWAHNPIPLIMGLNSGEGLIRTGVMMMYQTDFKWLSENLDQLAPMSLAYFASSSKPDVVTKEIRQYYLPGKEITMNNFENLTMMYTDSWFAVGSIDGANNHKGNVYFYYFDYPMSGKGMIPVPPEFHIGTFHCSDMALLWNLSVPMVPNIESEEEFKLSVNFIKLITDFMKYGNPTPEDSKFQWKKWSPKEHNYLNIDKSGMIMKKGLLEDRYNFWKGIKYRDNYD